jgi:hypothetical protein
MTRPSRVLSLADAAAFVERAGVALVFPKDDVVLPSLWEPIAGSTEVSWARRDEAGRFMEFTPEFERIWRWKDELPAKRLACAGQHGARPVSLVAPELVCAIYARTGLSGHPEDFRSRDDLNPLERELAEAVLELGPSTRPQLRRLVAAEKRRVDRAVESLQRRLVLTNVGVEDGEPGWPAVKVDVLPRHWRAWLARLPDLDTARVELARRVLDAAGEVSAADLAAALGWRRREATQTLDTLVDRGEAHPRDEDALRLWIRRV